MNVFSEHASASAGVDRLSPLSSAPCGRSLSATSPSSPSAPARAGHGRQAMLCSQSERSCPTRNRTSAQRLPLRFTRSRRSRRCNGRSSPPHGRFTVPCEVCRWEHVDDRGWADRWELTPRRCSFSRKSKGLHVAVLIWRCNTSPSLREVGVGYSGGDAQTLTWMRTYKNFFSLYCHNEHDF